MKKACSGSHDPLQHCLEGPAAQGALQEPLLCIPVRLIIIHVGCTVAVCGHDRSSVSGQKLQLRLVAWENTRTQPSSIHRSCSNHTCINYDRFVSVCNKQLVLRRIVEATGKAEGPDLSISHWKSAIAKTDRSWCVRITSWWG